MAKPPRWRRGLKSKNPNVMPSISGLAGVQPHLDDLILTTVPAFTFKSFIPTLAGPRTTHVTRPLLCVSLCQGIDPMGDHVTKVGRSKMVKPYPLTPSPPPSPPPCVPRRPRTGDTTFSNPRRGFSAAKAYPYMGTYHSRPFSCVQ